MIKCLVKYYNSGVRMIANSGSLKPAELPGDSFVTFSEVGNLIAKVMFLQ